MLLLALLKYVVVFGIALLGLVSALRTLRRGLHQWRQEPHHRFDPGSFFMAGPREWQHWPASHWLAAGGVVLIASVGLLTMGMLG